MKFGRCLLLSFAALSSASVAQSDNVRPIENDGAILVQAGYFDNNIGWLANEQGPDAATKQRIQHYVTDCQREATERMRVKLSTASAPVTASLPVDGYEDRNCNIAQIYVSIDVPDGTTRGQILAANATAKLIVDAYATGMDNGYGYGFAPLANDDPKSLANQINRAAMRADALRRMMSYLGRLSNTEIDNLTRSLARARLSSRVTDVDIEATEHLKGYIAENGWPVGDIWGAETKKLAWLIVQHSDQDPAFQYAALQLIEAKIGDDARLKPHYAYLYDRVMLKISGTQKFGTQFGNCQNGSRPFAPLISSLEETNQLRQAYGLPSLDEYRKQFEAMATPCPT